MSIQTKECKTNSILKRINSYKEYFEFNPTLSSDDDILDFINESISIKHLNCGHVQNYILSEWLHRAPYKLRSMNSNDANLLCPVCATKKIQNKIDKKYNNEFKINGLFVNSKTNLNIIHSKCNGEFSARYDSIISGDMACKICKEKPSLSKTHELNKKNKWLRNKLDSKNMNDFIPLEDYNGYNTQMTFLHTKCNNTFLETTNNLLRRANKCPACNKEAFIMSRPNEKLHEKHSIAEKINIIQHNMDNIHSGEFKLSRLNVKNNYTVELEHTICNRTFTDYRKKIYSNDLICPFCNTANKNNFISLNDKIKLYEERLSNNFKILNGFTTQKDKVNVQKISCGHIFETTMNSLLRKENTDYCPECRRLKRLDILITKLSAIHKDRITPVDAISNYKNINSKLLFTDNRCGSIFKDSFCNLLQKSIYFKCPNCKIEEPITKFKQDVFEKYNGEYRVLSDYIDSTTPIKFKHNKCEHIFYKTKYQFLNSKTPCKKCKEKSRSLGIKNAQIKVNKKFGSLFTLKGIYTNNHTSIPVVCNNCFKVEDVSLNKLVNRNKSKCCKLKFL